jgi:hypothetical protein
MAGARAHGYDAPAIRGPADLLANLDQVHTLSVPARYEYIKYFVANALDTNTPQAIKEQVEARGLEARAHARRPKPAVRRTSLS